MMSGTANRIKEIMSKAENKAIGVRFRVQSEIKCRNKIVLYTKIQHKN